MSQQLPTTGVLILTEDWSKYGSAKIRVNGIKTERSVLEILNYYLPTHYLAGQSEGTSLRTYTLYPRIFS